MVGAGGWEEGEEGILSKMHVPACVFEEEAISNWLSEDRCYFVSSVEEQSKASCQNQSKLSLAGTSREGKEENG